jgi:protein-disulfide isomerase
MRRFLALAVVLAACGAPQKRTEALEQRVATLEEQIVQLRAEIAERERARDDKDARQLDDTVAQVERKLRERPTRPPRPEPDPAAVYSVPVGTSPITGPRHAKVTMVVAHEFACPYCERSRAIIAELRTRYGNDLRIVHKSFIVHPREATGPAKAACAAHKQGRYDDMENALWEKSFKPRAFDDATLRRIAKGLRLDMKRFEADFTGATCAAEIEADQKLLESLGMRGTPAFWINGRYLVGARPADTFAVVIDEELAKANAAIQKGVKVEDYYDTVVASGLTRFAPAP